MKKILAGCVYSLLLTILWSANQNSSGKSSKIIVPETGTPPVIDGKLDDSSWKNAESFNLIQWRGKNDNADPTTVKILKDKDKLYIACECIESKGKTIDPKHHERDIYPAGENLEIFFDPNLNRSTYYQIVINPGNSIYDGYITNTGWNGDIDSATTVTDKGWNCEMSISLDSFDREPVKSIWGLNVCRFQKSTGAYTAWSPLKRWHHEPENFGIIAVGNGAIGNDLKDRIIVLENEFQKLEKNLKATSTYTHHQKKMSDFSNTLNKLKKEINGPDIDSCSIDKKFFIISELDLFAENLRLFKQNVDKTLGAEIRGKIVKDTPYEVSVENSVLKVNKDFVPSWPIKKEVDIEAARGESESFQVLIFNGSKPMYSTRVKLTNLVNGDAIIYGYQQKIWDVEYVSIAKPSVDNDITPPGALVADPLVPSNAFTVCPNDFHACWVTIKVPRDAVPGTYKGTIIVSAPGFPDKRIPVKLKVWDFSLPITAKLKNTWGLWEKKNFDLKFIYDIPRKSKELNKLLTTAYDMLLDDYRLTPRGTVVFNPADDWKRYKSWLKNKLKRGLTTISFGSKNPEDMKKYQEIMEENNILDRAFVRPGDEPTPERLPPIVERVKKWRKNAPKINMAICSNYYKDFIDNYVDIWIPLTPCYDKQTVSKLRKEGKKVWFYVCNVPNMPYANPLSDSPAIDHRMLFWQAFDLGAEGFLYWNVVNFRYGDPWAKNEGWKGSNGDGFLLYPGTNGPLPSIRLEVIRDSLEDYDFLAMLKESIQKAKKEGKATSLIPVAEKLLDISSFAGSLTRYTRDPDVLLARRRQIGEMLEKFNRELNDKKYVNP